jgi:CHAT domain-containing protein
VLWSLLPSLRDTDTTIAPSAASWLAASQREATRTGRIVLVAGPGLAAADHEVAGLHDLYPDAEVFTGNEARVGEVLAALEATDLVHIAAHGVFRSDSPMFSRVELADGPLTVYDLEQLRRPPRTVVLSACEAAAARYCQSGGALGTARALLSIGSSTVVAALLAVEDEATRDHMVCLHQHLATGSSVAHALRLATHEAFETGDRRRIAAAGSFITIGAG